MKWFWYAYILAVVMCCSCARRTLTRGSEESVVDNITMRASELSKMEATTDRKCDSTFEVFWEKWMVDARGNLVLTDKEHKKLRWGSHNTGVVQNASSSDSEEVVINDRSRHTKEKEICKEEMSSKPPDVAVVVFVLLIFGAVFLYIRNRR